MQRLGHAADGASNGRTAAALIGQTEYDLIVTDITMPGHTGLELLAKAKERDPHVQVIIITADATTDKAIEALNRGAFAFLTKPFPHLNVIDQTVQRALEFRRLIVENQQMAAAQRKRGDLLEDEVQERLMQVRRQDKETREILARIPEGILIHVRGRAMPSNIHAEKWLAADETSPERPLAAFFETLAEGSGDRATVVQVNGSALDIQAIDLSTAEAAGYLVILRDLSEPMQALSSRLTMLLSAIRRDLEAAMSNANGDGFPRALRRLMGLEALLRRGGDLAGARSAEVVRAADTRKS
jgi:CheY-like chemotaxis protein